MSRSLFPPDKRTSGLDREQQDILQHSNAIGKALRVIPFLDGIAVTSVTLTTSPLVVAHPLGRVPKGCPLILSTNVPTAIADTASARTATTATLTAFVNCVVTLWWF